MGHFGQELRRERESRGIALEAITGDTKISGRHLLSLEEGQFDALPGGVLSKGIVRGYARVVGLDEEDCVRRYLAACRQSGLEQEEDAGWTEFAANVGRNRKGEFEGRTGLQWAGVALLLTLLAVFGWYVAHFVQARVSQAELSPAPAAASPSPGTVSPSSDPDAAAQASAEPAESAPLPSPAAPQTLPEDASQATSRADSPAVNASEPIPADASADRPVAPQPAPPTLP